MATPLTVSIPPLLDGQQISAWEPKFRASDVSLEQGATIRLLPAYIKRGRLEERVVLDAIQKEKLDDAFQLLKEQLDPAVDELEAANRFRQLIWPVGEPVHDFVARYLEEGIKEGLSAKQVCVI